MKSEPPEMAANSVLNKMSRSYSESGISNSRRSQTMCTVNKPSRLTTGASTSGLHPASSRRLAASDAIGKASISADSINTDFNIGRISFVSLGAGTTSERPECLLGGNRGTQLEIIPRLLGFFRSLNFEEIHVVDHASVHSQPAGFAEEVYRGLAHLTHHVLGALRPGRLHGTQVMHRSGVHACLNHIRHLLPALEEPPRPGATLVVEVPVKGRSEIQSLRLRQAQIVDVVKQIAEDGEPLLAITANTGRGRCPDSRRKVPGRGSEADHFGPRLPSA